MAYGDNLHSPQHRPDRALVAAHSFSPATKAWPRLLSYSAMRPQKMDSSTAEQRTGAPNVAPNTDPRQPGSIAIEVGLIVTVSGFWLLLGVTGEIPRALPKRELNSLPLTVHSRSSRQNQTLCWRMIKTKRTGTRIYWFQSVRLCGLPQISRKDKRRRYRSGSFADGMAVLADCRAASYHLLGRL